MQVMEKYMSRCIELAEMGKGNVAPNPMVGAVIILDNKIIGEGYHRKYGEAHAEVNAINSVKDKSQLSKATIYVSLEPCAHFGKTPPCSDLIIQYKIPNVVVGCVDTYSEVSGKGIEKIKNSGAKVIVGVLEQECIQLNKAFFTFHRHKRPFVILKWAQTRDGFMDKQRSENERGVNWITQPETKQLTHKWRSEASGILVGTATAIIDNPSLTVRKAAGSNPVRLLLDRSLKVALNANVFSKEAETVVFNTEKEGHENNVTWKKVDNWSSVMEQVYTYCYENEIQTLIIEGGQQTLNSIIKNGTWDEARVLEGNTRFKKGLKAPIIEGYCDKRFTFGADLIKIYFND